MCIHVAYGTGYVHYIASTNVSTFVRPMFVDSIMFEIMQNKTNNIGPMLKKAMVTHTHCPSRRLW